jgi:hypothetical protein
MNKNWEMTWLTSRFFFLMGVSREFFPEVNSPYQVKRGTTTTAIQKIKTRNYIQPL